MIIVIYRKQANYSGAASIM